MQQALGLVETRGLVASIEAADAMLKASKVKLISKQRAEAGLITIVIVGDVAAVKASVDAGAAAAQKVGELVSVHVIPRPDDQIGSILPLDADIVKVPVTETGKPKPTAKPVSKVVSKVEEMEVKIPETKKEVIKEEEPVKVNYPVSSSETIERLKREALGKAPVVKKKEKKVSESKIDLKEIENFNVHELRHFARSVENFPIKGREISRANRKELLEHFKSLK